MAEQFLNPDKIKEEKERIKEEVQAFREQTEGLNPEMFNVPGEEDLEKENIPEEMIFAYELEEKIAEYTKKVRLMKDSALEEMALKFDLSPKHQLHALSAILGFSALINSPLWSEIDKEKQEELIEKAKLAKNNALKQTESYLDRGQTNQEDAWFAIRSLSAFISSPLWPEISKGKQEELIEKAKLAKNNALKQTESYLDRGQTDQGSAWLATLSLSSLINSPLWPEIDKGKQEELIEKTRLVKTKVLEEIELYFDGDRTGLCKVLDVINRLLSLTTLKNYLLKVANQKLKEQEHQKALHPKKDIPPRPETKIF